MHDIVLIPTFRRPEYLTLCLEHIAAALPLADGWKQIIVMHDMHGRYAEPVDASRRVVESFKEKLQIEFHVRAPHNYYGNSYNCLELYRQALDQPGVRLIYLIEDDVLVTPYFFAWHEAVQDRSNYFATVGWTCFRNTNFKRSDNPCGYIETNKDYASIGVCWRPEKLATFVAHATPEYYDNSAAYLQRTFPSSQYGAGWTEQDGIITRMLEEANNRWVAWPSRSRCFHVGVSGFHRAAGHQFKGLNARRDLDECVEELRAALLSNTIKSLVSDPFGDVEYSTEVTPPWLPENLYVAQRLGIL